ncbi:MAG: non-homologous end-joining DNA ligase [Acidimicrobiia bacterium]|nr:non-homologous end-joining DNA ligase [Acidimicrobiia bacterium]
MLATLTDECPAGEGWVFERKLDGVRCLAVRDGRGVHLRSRTQRPLDRTYPEIVEALEQEGTRPLLLDGEIVAFEGEATSFARLQRRMQIQDPDRARRSGVAVFYYVFDLLHLDGRDLTGLTLRRRKALLEEAIRFRDPLRLNAHHDGDGPAHLREACARGWEGLIAKRAGSRYVGGRSRSWLKLKCVRRQELVVGGYTDPEGGRSGFGALLVGYHDGSGRLRYAGKVGTGFDEVTLEHLGRALRDLEVAASPFVDDPGDRGVHHVRPVLVCEVAFTEWTRVGRLRQPRYLGVRGDKDPRDVVREVPSRGETRGT